MADQKISQLTTLIGADAATGDLIPVVDVSTSTTKKMTRTEFFKGTPPIGVGTDSPVVPLHVVGAGFTTLRVESTGVDFDPEFSLTNDNGGASAWTLRLDKSNANAFGLRYNNAEKMTVDTSGNVGIGDNTPDVALDVVGDINYTGTITDVSDRRLKENVQDLSGSLDKICQLDAKSYTLIADRGNENTTVELGFIAQEVQPVFPEIVKEVQKYAVDENGQDTTEEVNYLGVSYIQLIAPMVEAIKELKLKNDTLEARIVTLGG